ncbi:DUF1129 domain-containing protein [Leuconostoc gelidum subsp. gelidum]|uniref:DUF1129 domain-containing protein n=1 Tax=Leuconostoc gelidum TaxID=1244 RepID=UPI001CC48482|nr:DUF1129 family protein [Leuconostoc gelidum]MBZ6014633.1 DUF1129 domain-containing protein [Leuconostoc gelidum subsp. gelidum]
MSEKREQLTKKNEDFIFRFKKLMLQNSQLSADKIAEVTNEVEQKLIEAQGTGQTAAQLYGTPTQAVQQFLDPRKLAKKLHDYKFWNLAADTSLAILMLFCAVFGLSLFFSKSTTNQGAGIVSLFLIAILGGSIYTAVILKLTPDPKKIKNNGQKNYRWLYLIGAVAAWIIGFIVLGLLPQVINPTLPPVAYIVLAIAAYGAFRWNRQYSGLKGGFLAISQLSQQARLEAAQAKK